MANLNPDPSFMLDVQLTQRMLLEYSIISRQGWTGHLCDQFSSAIVAGWFLIDALMQKMQQLRWQKLDKLSALVLVVADFMAMLEAGLIVLVGGCARSRYSLIRLSWVHSRQRVPNISSFALFNEPAATTAQDNRIWNYRVSYWATQVIYLPR